jgi:large subunit ribosomal protein L25
MDISRARRLVSLLPSKLTNFFVKYPPRDPTLNAVYSKKDPSVLIAKKLHDFEPVPTSLHTTTVTEDATNTNVRNIFFPFQNPFQPSRDLRTGKFIGPRYSLRRQADIIKLAIRYGVADLLPPSKKMEKILRGKARPMIGTLRPKGTYQERTRRAYVEKKEKALEKALRRVAMFKTVMSSKISVLMNSGER